MSAGRRQPPAEHRFRKGTSGNPKGRPRKARSQGSAFDIILDRTLTVMQDGCPRELTIEEALEQQTYQQAISGSRTARREVLKMIVTREQELAARPPVRRQAAQVLMEHGDPDNADQALLILGIAQLDPKWNESDRRLLLEPWAVQAALSRRRKGVMRPADVDDIRRSTSTPEVLRGLEAGTG